MSVLVELTRLSEALAERVLERAFELGDPGALTRDPSWVVARSYRRGDFRPTAGAAGAFERICRKHLPASLTRFAADVAERETRGETPARAA